jgi:hypothetical protein
VIGHRIVLTRSAKEAGGANTQSREDKNYSILVHSRNTNKENYYDYDRSKRTASFRRKCGI